jgi:hypothetical protein
MATLSVASMASYNQFGGETFKMQSYKTYGHTIRMIQDTIQIEDQTTNDKVIAAVLLMHTQGWYGLTRLCGGGMGLMDRMRDIGGERPDQDNEHAPGLFYLLQKRGLEQLTTRRGTEILLLALLRLVSTSLNALLSSFLC